MDPLELSASALSACEHVASSGSCYIYPDKVLPGELARRCIGWHPNVCHPQDANLLMTKLHAFPQHEHLVLHRCMNYDLHEITPHPLGQPASWIYSAGWRSPCLQLTSRLWAAGQHRAGQPALHCCSFCCGCRCCRMLEVTGCSSSCPQEPQKRRSLYHRPLHRANHG